MIDPSLKSHKHIRTRRHLLFVCAVAILIAGCGQPEAHVAIPFTVPDEFSDERGTWQRIEGDLSASDNRQIGQFFKTHSSLIGSPDWTGQPNKFVSQKSRSLERFYWFSGNSENPSWNAIEFNGASMRQLRGIGTPGADAEK